MMSEKKFIVRYQTEVLAEDLFDAIKKAEEYGNLELFINVLSQYSNIN